MQLHISDLIRALLYMVIRLRGCKQMQIRFPDMSG